ncbi:MAG: DMT family transporter [Burkholderiaceae bacterium]
MQSLWMLAAALLFSLMGVCVKLASETYSVAEIVFYRSLLGALGLAGFVRWRGLSLATPYAWMHLRRGVIGTIALSLWFFATTVLPVGTAMTLNYTSPLFLATFMIGLTVSAGRPVEWPLAAAVGMGFIGVILVLQPSFTHGQEVAAGAGLASGVLSAVAYWHVKELGKLREPEWRTVFYFSLAGAVLGLGGSLIQGFSRHTASGLWLVGGVAVFATLAQLAMTRAYGKGSTLLVATLQFSAIVFASILGVLVFGDRIGFETGIGIAIILGSGIGASALGARAMNRATRSLAKS